MKPAERDAAKKAGLTQYFTGKPCLNGHVAKRSTATGQCLECQRGSRKRYNAAPGRKEAHRLRQAKRVRDGLERAAYKRNPRSRWLAGARSRAKRSSVPFDLTAADIVIPTHCPVLGCKLEIGDNRQSDTAPSLDRLRPERGYVRGNVFVISYKANRWKNNASPQDLRTIADWMERMLRVVP